MAWKLDRFDTEILGVPSYKSDTATPSEGNGFFTVFASVQQEDIETLTNDQFKCIGIRNTYRLHGQPMPSNEQPQDITVHLYDGTVPLSKDDIHTLARPVWEYSRYCKDTKIATLLSLALYQAWFENSFLHDYADFCFVAYAKQTIVGCCTVKIKDAIGYIDLVSVLPAFQRQGVGSVLLDQTIQHLLPHVREIVVVTEGENIPANRLYQKKGFLIEKTSLVFHKHI